MSLKYSYSHNQMETCLSSRLCGNKSEIIPVGVNTFATLCKKLFFLLNPAQIEIICVPPGQMCLISACALF